MAGKAKVVLTDYVWESLEVEKKTLSGLAELVALQTKKPDEFIAEAKDCDALLNTYAGPITADVMAQMPKCKIIARYGIGVDTIDVTAVSTDALGLNHSGYAENPALLDDVKALVEFGLRPPDKRIKNVLTVESEAGTFWRFQVAK